MESRLKREIHDQGRTAPRNYASSVEGMTLDLSVVDYMGLRTYMM